MKARVRTRLESLMLPFRAKRFWLPRDAEVELTSDGFPLDPDSPLAPFLTTRLSASSRSQNTLYSA